MSQTVWKNNYFIVLLSIYYSLSLQHHQNTGSMGLVIGGGDYEYSHNYKIRTFDTAQAFKAAGVEETVTCSLFVGSYRSLEFPPLFHPLTLIPSPSSPFLQSSSPPVDF